MRLVKMPREFRVVTRPNVQRACAHKMNNAPSAVAILYVEANP